MQWNDISPSGKKKLVRWLRKMNRMHRIVCISRIIATAQNERKLMKMTRFIDKCHEIKALRTTTEASKVSTSDLEQNIEPESFRTIYPEGVE